MDIKANDPSLKTWAEVPENSDFPIQNLPFGIFKTTALSPRVGVAIGDQVLDVAILNAAGLLNELEIPQEVFENEYLNDLMALGRPVARKLRNRLSDILQEDNEVLRDNADLRAKALRPQKEVDLLMPVDVKDYTDFYSSKEHATNVGTMFRDPDNALLPNWKYIPVGYHGRASSIVVSGTELHRPKGQTKPDEDKPPVFGPCKLLDFELEMAFVTCRGNQLGSSIHTHEAEDHIFGMVIFNDWSARDIQKWEYVPLGPFLAKNWASSISPWVVTLDALEPFRTGGPKQDPPVLEYLAFEGDKSFDINLEAYIQPENSDEVKVCTTNFKYMYWNMSQQLAHHTVNGCNARVGDMYASGTISGADPSSFGSMLELGWKGTKPIKMPDGSERKFINDHDTVIMRGYSEKNGVRIGFGEVSGKILPAV